MSRLTCPLESAAFESDLEVEFGHLGDGSLVVEIFPSPQLPHAPVFVRDEPHVIALSAKQVEMESLPHLGQLFHGGEPHRRRIFGVLPRVVCHSLTSSGHLHTLQMCPGYWGAMKRAHNFDSVHQRIHTTLRSNYTRVIRSKRSMSNVSPEEHREHLWHDRRELIDAHRDNSRSQDRTVLTLSGGALVLSVAFLSDVWSDPSWVPLLIVAWASFALSVGAMLLAFPVATKRINDQIAEINRDIYHGTTKTTPPKTHPWIARLNTTAVIFFFVGLIAIGAFATINLLDSDTRNENLGLSSPTWK